MDFPRYFSPNIRSALVCTSAGCGRARKKRKNCKTRQIRKLAEGRGETRSGQTKLFITHLFFVPKWKLRNNKRRENSSIVTIRYRRCSFFWASIAKTSWPALVYFFLLRFFRVYTAYRLLKFFIISNTTWRRWFILSFFASYLVSFFNTFFNLPN